MGLDRGRGLQILKQLRPSTLNTRAIQALLGLEVLVDERLRDPAPLRDLLHRRATKTVMLELALGHIEDPMLALGAREPAHR